MEKTIIIGLAGHDERYRLNEDAYGRLARYLDEAGSRLRNDPDRAEILDDLERSIGDRLTALLGADERLLVAADIDGVLEQIGAVEAGRDPAATETVLPRGRRLYRIRGEQKVAGVCAGLAAYSELNVAWVRTLFVIGTVVTAGFGALVYIALAFILPVTATREA